MRYHRHYAVVITDLFGADARTLQFVANKARDLGLEVIGPSEAAGDGCRSLLVCPDGLSYGDARRADLVDARVALHDFLCHLRQGVRSLDWVEVSFGAGGEQAAIERVTRCPDA